MNDTILITGGTGFAGSHLVERLLKTHPAEAIHVTNYSDTESFVHTLLPQGNIHQLDLTQQQPTFELLNQLKPTQLYHLASFSSPQDSFEKAKAILHNNTELQITILEAIKQCPSNPKAVIISSSAVYESSDQPLAETAAQKPLNPYAISKQTQDSLARYYQQVFDLDLVIARPFNHVGERQEPNFAIPAFAKQIALIEKGEQDALKVGDLSAIRDFTYVKDTVAAYHLLMEQGTPGDIYNIGTGNGVKMSAVLDMLTQLSDTEIHVKQDASRLRPIEVASIVADPEKITNLGWHPEHDLRSTLQRILNYWRENT